MRAAGSSRAVCRRLFLWTFITGFCWWGSVVMQQNEENFPMWYFLQKPRLSKSINILPSLCFLKYILNIIFWNIDLWTIISTKLWFIARAHKFCSCICCFKREICCWIMLQWFCVTCCKETKWRLENPILRPCAKFSRKNQLNYSVHI